MNPPNAKGKGQPSDSGFKKKEIKAVSTAE